MVFSKPFEIFLSLCFAMNRHNYARNFPYYFISMLNLQDSHPNIYQYLNNGGFTASISDLPFSKIPCDQLIETTINRSSKSNGGLSGKTENVRASEKWMRINHIRPHCENTWTLSFEKGQTKTMLKCSHKHWRNGFLVYGHQSNLWSILQVDKKPLKKWSKTSSL